MVPAKPVLFGILNITEDSFSDGGRFLAPAAALDHARAMMRDGADVIDIGAAASNPDTKAVASDVEIARLAPVVAALQTENVPVSIDSFSSAVQCWALGQKVDYLNDIQGFSDPAIYPDLARSDAKLIVMHSVQAQGPATRVEILPSEIFERVQTFFENRIDALVRAGIARDRLILDPGMGFFLGGHADASFEMLQRFHELKACFDLPVLISVSRKSFLRKVTGRVPEQAGAATLAAELFVASQGVDMLRTHDPAGLSDALKVWHRLDKLTPSP